MEEIKTEIILIAKIMAEMLLLDMEEEIELEVNIPHQATIHRRKMDFCKYLFAKDFKSVEPVSTSLFSNIRVGKYKSTKTSKDDVESKKWGFGT